MRVRQQRQRQFRFGADRVEARRIEDHQALFEQRVRKIDDRVSPAWNLDESVVPGVECFQRIIVDSKAQILGCRAIDASPR